ncbi:hypothetical protein D3C80_1863570 [compost metagenome]
MRAKPHWVSGENGGKMNTSMKLPTIMKGKAAMKPSRIACTYFCWPIRPARGLTRFSMVLTKRS